MYFEVGEQSLSSDKAMWGKYAYEDGGVKCSRIFYNGEGGTTIAMSDEYTWGEKRVLDPNDEFYNYCTVDFYDTVGPLYEPFSSFKYVDGKYVCELEDKDEDGNVDYTYRLSVTIKDNHIVYYHYNISSLPQDTMEIVCMIDWSKPNISLPAGLPPVPAE